MNKKEFIECVKRAEVAELRERLREIEDIGWLRYGIKVTADPEVKEELEKRIAEIEKKVEKKRWGKYEIEVTAVGLGGCGLNVVTQISKAAKRFEDYYKIDYYAYDLSDDVKRAEIEGIKIVKPTTLDIGAGRIPFCAEFVFNEGGGWEEAKGKIYPSSINLLSHSLGGGTGSKTASLLIQKLREVGGFSYITLSVLTDRDALEKTNHLLTFSELNKTADFIILAENKRGREIKEENKIKTSEQEFINKKMVDIFDFMISARNKDAYPGPVDFNNYINFLRGRGEYNEGIRWFIPFVWPIIDDYESKYNDYPLFRFLTMALNRGSLVRVRSDDIKCNSCILIIKAPDDFIHSVNIDETKMNLAKKLGLKEDFITATFVPDERGLKLCLLLYGMPFEMLYELMDVDDEIINFGLNSWKEGIKNYMEQLKTNITDAKKKEYEEKIKDPREDFIKMYGETMRD